MLLAHLLFLLCLTFASVKAGDSQTWKASSCKRIIEDALSNVANPVDDAAVAFAAIITFNVSSPHFPRANNAPKLPPFDGYKEIITGKATNSGAEAKDAATNRSKELRNLAYVANAKRTERCGRLLQVPEAKKAVALAILRFFATSPYTENFTLNNKLGPLLLMTCPLDKVYEGAEDLLVDYKPLSDLVLTYMPSPNESVPLLNDPELSALWKMRKDDLSALLPILKAFAVSYSVADQSAQNITDESSAVIAETLKHINANPPVLVKDMKREAKYPLIKIIKILSDSEYDLFPYLFMNAYAEHDDFSLLIDFLEAFSSTYKNFVMPLPMDVRQSRLARRLLLPENLKILFKKKPKTGNTEDHRRAYVDSILNLFCPNILQTYTLMAMLFPGNVTVQEMLRQLEVLQLQRLPEKNALSNMMLSMTESQFDAFQSNLPPVRPL